MRRRRSGGEVFQRVAVMMRAGGGRGGETRRGDLYDGFDEDNTSAEGVGDDIFGRGGGYEPQETLFGGGDREEERGVVPESYSFDYSDVASYDRASASVFDDDLRLQEAARWLKEKGTLRNAFKHPVGAVDPTPKLITSCRIVPATTSKRIVIEAMDVDLEQDAMTLRTLRMASSQIKTTNGDDTVPLRLPAEGAYNANYFRVFGGNNGGDTDASDDKTETSDRDDGIVATQLREEAVQSILELARHAGRVSMQAAEEESADGRDVEEELNACLRQMYSIVSSAEDYGILDDSRMHHGITMAYIANSDMVGAVHAIRDAEMLGVTPLGETYTLLLRTFARSGAVEDAEAVLGALENAGYNPRGAWCVLSTTLAEGGMTDDFVRNMNKGLELGYKPTEDMWESYIRALIQSGDLKTASHLVHGFMLDCGIERQARFDNIVLRGFIERENSEGERDVVGARSWMELRMLDGPNPTQPNAESFNILLEGTIISPIADEDPVLRCCIMVDEMRKVSVKPDASTWTYMIIYCATYPTGSDWIRSFYYNFRDSFARSAAEAREGKDVENPMIRDVLASGKGANEMLLRHENTLMTVMNCITSDSNFQLMYDFIRDCIDDKVTIPRSVFVDETGTRPTSFYKSAVITSPVVTSRGETPTTSPGLMWYALMISYPRRMNNLDTAPQEAWKPREHSLSLTNISQIFPKNIKSTIVATDGPLKQSRKLSITKMKVDEIREALSDAGLETWGTRPVLASRLREHLEQLKQGTVTPEAVREKAKKDLDARKQGLEPAADFKVYMGEHEGSLLLSDLQTSSWGSRGQEAVMHVAGVEVPIGELVSGSFDTGTPSAIKIRNMAQYELKVYLELLPMCSRVGIRPSALDFGVMLQCSCGLADVQSSVKILLHFRKVDVREAWTHRRIVNPIQYLVTHCFSSHERSTTVGDGMLVLETMRRVGLGKDAREIEEIVRREISLDDDGRDRTGDATASQDRSSFAGAL